MKWHPKGLYALFIPFCPNARPAPPTYEDMFAKREMRVIRFFLQEKTTERRLKINPVTQPDPFRDRKLATFLTGIR